MTLANPLALLRHLNTVLEYRRLNIEELLAMQLALTAVARLSDAAGGGVRTGDTLHFDRDAARRLQLARTPFLIES